MTPKEIEQESCRLFDTGRFNDIVLAYVVLSMQYAGTAREEALKLLDALGQGMDEMTAEQALERYRGVIMRSDVDMRISKS